MLRGLRLAFVAGAIFAASATLSVAAPSDGDSSCLFGTGAMAGPNIPPSLVYAQKYSLVGDHANYSAILKNGLVLISTHMACEHYGASVVLSIPVDQYDPKKGVGEQVQTLLTWYMGKKNADEIATKIKGQTLVDGWQKDFSNATDEFPNVTIHVHGLGETYVIVDVYYYSALG